MLLKLENIHKSFGNPESRNYRPVLDGISLQIDASESLAILGPSGSGKSTLLNIMGALDTPDKGHIQFNNQPLNGLSENQMAEVRNREFGFIFQLHHLLPQCNVLENVLVPTLPLYKDVSRKEMMAQAEQLIRDVGLWEQRFDFPSTLSGGECQRVAVIRAMINQPKLILADEPTGSLDHENAVAVIQLLLQLKEKYQTALVIVTHSEEIATGMDKSYRLTDGRLSAIKT
jgi:ABC-type lipoprotein export system ATPase subunit